MNRRKVALDSTKVLLASILAIPIWAEAGNPSFSGTWQAPDKSAELVVEQTGDDIHVTEQSRGKTLLEYTCNSKGKDCNFKDEGKKAKVSVYFVRQGLRAVLAREASFEVIGESGDGREAVRLADALQPHIVIMDISMPQLNGIEAAKQIVKANPRTHIIILSMHSDETYLIRALHAGVKGFLLKESAEEDLIRAVRMVAQGKPFFSPAVTSAVLADYMRDMQQRNLRDSYDLLTEREKEVLQLLAEGKSNKEAAIILDLSTNTVETHRMNLMQKLGLHNTAEIVLYAVRKKIIQ